MIDWAKETVFITGINGFVGKNLCARLVRSGATVWGGDLSLSEHPRGAHHVVTLDLRNNDEVSACVAKINPSYVFHLGSHVVLDRDYTTATVCLESNARGTLNLLEACKNLAQPPRRILYASTEEVYGVGAIPYQESQVPLPPSPYAISKIAAELYLLMYYRLHNLPVTILRLATLYGPYQASTRFIPRLIKQALAGEPIQMHSGNSQRDYVFVEDVVDALLLAAESEMARGEIINISSAQATSGKELAAMILSLTKSVSAVTYGALKERLGESTHWLASIQKAKKCLGWEPVTTLRAGLVKTIDFYKQEGP